ncbi:hypothetical protein [Acidithiobacillus albertensis]|uniref:hypothetical protein n=1 Tax=Acidithiobacillus albertensis TaxID=119978 RepID=UPI00094B59D7|nr:hypothetical protein [Acidithiobacillus albertensis]MDD5279741.1 hypothetical protein [Acidithiobacillus sp.]
MSLGISIALHEDLQPRHSNHLLLYLVQVPEYSRANNNSRRAWFALALATRQNSVHDSLLIFEIRVVLCSVLEVPN